MTSALRSAPLPDPALIVQRDPTSWRGRQAAIQIIGASDRSNTRLASQLRFYSPGVVKTIREALAGEVPNFESHDDMGRWFKFAAETLGWEARTRQDFPLPHLGKRRRLIADLVIAEPFGRGPRYVVEFKTDLRYQRDLADGVRQVSRYADCLEEQWPGHGVDAVLCAPSIAVADAAAYGSARGVAVLTTAELATHLIRQGWLDLEAS
jgi:hypothetical protein